MAALPPSDRVMALLEWGDVAEADAAIAAAGPGWRPQVWRGARALLEGRFHACEGLARLAAAEGGADAELPSMLLMAALRREQDRPAEAESLLRLALERYPASAGPGAAALLAVVVGDMGRDGRARAELTRLLPRQPVVATGHVASLVLLAELAAAVDAPDEELAILYRRLSPHARDFAVEPGLGVVYGSVAGALGRLSQARGAWEDAISHYEEAEAAHRRVGAPVLLAHTQRHLAALLRTRSADGDWERALDLLAQAATIYRLLGVDGLAAKTQAVLARAEDGGSVGPGNGRGARDRSDGLAPGTLFRRSEGTWLVGPPDDPAHLRDAPGLRDIARLLAAAGVGLHVGELAGPVPVADDITRREYQVRLDELAAELIEAERGDDAVAASLLRAERDVLVAALEEAAPPDPVDLARRTVGIRIRLGLDRIDRVRPDVGRHLRRSIRTGTFFAYSPDRRVRWSL